MDVEDTVAADLDARVERLIRSNLRARRWLLVLAVFVPAVLFAVFERQARRLDALGDHGAVGHAVVVGASDDGTFYEYTVDGVRYDWNVAREDAPYALGATFPIVYVPEDPSLSRPGGDRGRGATEAASNRSFATRLEAGVFAFFALFSVVGEVQLHGLRTRGRAELTDPAAYRRRLAWSLLPVTPFLALIFGWHATDALRKGESLWPVALATVMTLGIIGGTVAYVLRDGQAGVAARSAALVRYVAPLAVAAAAIRLLLLLFGG